MNSSQKSHFSSSAELFLYFFEVGRTRNTNAYELEAALFEIGLHKFSAGQLVGILAGIGRCYQMARGKGASAGNAFREVIAANIQPWLEQAQAALDNRNPVLNMSPVGTGLTIAVMGSLGIKPCETFLGLWQNTVLRQLDDNKIDAQSIHSIAHGLATLGVYPGHTFMEQLCQKGLTLLERGNFEPRDRDTFLQSLAMLDALMPCPVAQNAANTILDVIAPQKADRISLQWLQAARHFDISLGKSVPYARETPDTSLSEKLIAESFIRVVGLRNVDLSHKIKGLNHRTDVMVSLGAGRSLIIESDGPFHFVNGCSLNGRTVLMSEVMVKRRPNAAVIRLPHFITDNWGLSNDDIDRKVESFLDSAETLAPGGYVYRNGDVGFSRLFERDGARLRYTACTFA